MKPLLLLPLALLAAAPTPPAGRVTFAPLTRAAYWQAMKEKIVVSPRVTFPLRKQRGRLVIPTAKGVRVFRDGWVQGRQESETRYTYLGYWPGLRWHTVEGYHYGEVYRLYAVTQSGQQLGLAGSPGFSPDTSQFVVASGALDGMGGPSIQLYRRRQGNWKEVWKMEPTTWQVEQLEWIAPSVLLLRQKHWSPDFSTSWYTYARLTVR